MQKSSTYVLSSLLLTLGCSSNDAADSVNWTTGRGTDACHHWQEAYCQLLPDCGEVGVATCAEQIQTIACLDDATATSCASTIATGVCSSLTSGSGCSLGEIADATPAIQACNNYLAAVCTHNANCGSNIDVATCVTNMQENVSCNKALGVKSNYESCMSKLNATACTATALPADCDSLFYLTS